MANHFSRAMLIFTAIVLAGAGLAAVGSGWVLASFSTEAVIAETLQQTDSLRSGYAFGWVLAWVGIGVVLLLSVVRWARIRQGATRLPLPWIWVYGGIHLALAWLLGLLDAGQHFNVSPDVMTYVLLTVQIYAQLLLPLMLLAVLARALWRWTRAQWSAERRGAQVGAMLVTGLTVASLFIVAGVFNAAAYRFQADRLSEILACADGPDDALRTHQDLAANTVSPRDAARPGGSAKGGMMSASAGVSPGGTAEPLDDRSASKCVKNLIDQGELALCRRRATVSFPNDGEHIAWGALERVCRKAPDLQDPVMFFSKSCTNAIRTALRKRRKRGTEVEFDPVRDLRSTETLDLTAQRIQSKLACLRKGAAQLSAREYEIIQLAMNGHGRAEVRDRLGVSASALDQAIKRLKDRIEAACPPRE